MSRAAIGAALIAIGAAGALAVLGTGPEPKPVTATGAPLAARGRVADRTEVGGSERLERRLTELSARLAEETRRRRLLEQRLEGLEAELAALLPGGTEQAAEGSTAPGQAETAAAAIGDAAAAAPPAPPAESETPTSPLEQALVAAGVDARTADDIRRRRDELTLAEMYLRDQATREEWLGSPRFAEEMAEIQAQRSSIRDEIGDDAYDRYLAAAGEANRVRVDEVMVESPAALAGLQPGDVVLRYGDRRIFAPEDLVAETRGGTAGESVRLQVLRHGERVEIDVTRGPLGLRIAATQGPPGGG